MENMILLPEWIKLDRINDQLCSFAYKDMVSLVFFNTPLNIPWDNGSVISADGRLYADLVAYQHFLNFLSHILSMRPFDSRSDEMRSILIKAQRA